MAITCGSIPAPGTENELKEIQSLEKLGATILTLAKEHPHMDKSLNVDSIKRDVIEGLKIINELIAEKTYDMLVMDEIIISVRDNFIEEAKLIAADMKNQDVKDMVEKGQIPEIVAIISPISF